MNPERAQSRIAKVRESYKHLKEGIKPIIACVGTEEEFRNPLTKEVYPYVLPDKSPNSMDEVNFYARSDELRSKGFKNPAERTYVISPVGSRNKFSEKYFDCLFVVAVGISKQTGENISFMAHLKPENALGHSREDFVRDFLNSLEELKDKSQEGSIDIVIGGGYFLPMFFNKESRKWVDSKREYEESIKTLSQATKGVVGFEPLGITGPKNEPAWRIGDSTFFDNENRRLYIVRPNNMNGMSGSSGNPANAPYMPSDIAEESKNWE